MTFSFLQITSLRAALLHLDFHAHPRVDAALIKMFTLRKTRDIDMASLKDSSSRHLEIRKAIGALRDCGFSPVEWRDKTATEFLHLGERVGLAALVDYGNKSSFLNAEYVGFEVPFLVRSAGRCLGK